MLVQNHQIECALADVSPWGQWPHLVFLFQGCVQLSSLRTSLLVLPALQQLVTYSQVTSLVLEVLRGWNLILYVNGVPACLQ